MAKESQPQTRYSYYGKSSRRPMDSDDITRFARAIDEQQQKTEKYGRQLLINLIEGSPSWICMYQYLLHNCEISNASFDEIFLSSKIDSIVLVYISASSPGGRELH
uniref:Uncharacterized protein n=1 Tax=Megaselia scalaris TaxID=36166 RepID=T1H441_MEGSC